MARDVKEKDTGSQEDLIRGGLPVLRTKRDVAKRNTTISTLLMKDEFGGSNFRKTSTFVVDRRDKARRREGWDLKWDYQNLVSGV